MNAFEQAFIDASKQLSGTTLGALFIVIVLLFVGIIILHRRDLAAERASGLAALKEVKEEVKAEREAHQQTRERYMAALGKVSDLSQAFEDSRMNDMRTQQLITENLQKIHFELRDIANERRRG